MRFRLLGPFGIETEGGSIVITRRRERSLLAALLLHNGQSIQADRLAYMLWDGQPPASGRQQLHSHVSRLRSALRQTTASVRASRTGYLVEVDNDCVDALRFEAEVAAARATDDHEARRRRLRAALDLWRGDALEDSASDWLRPRLVGELEELRLAATEDWLECALVACGPATVLPELQRRVHAHPDRERFLELWMRALHLDGRYTEALRVFARYRERLADELGADPGPALQALHVAILRAGPGDAHAEPAQAGHAGSSIDTMVQPAQLPATARVFVGRHHELNLLDSLTETAERWAPPIACVTGPGGSGKTALVLRWAQRARHHFPDGQLYVDLGGFSSGPRAHPSDVLSRFLQALGLTGGQLPLGVDAQVNAYRSLVAERRMLIVLDNAADMDQIRPLMPAAPRSAIVVTSRHYLPQLVALYDAFTVEVGPLPSTDSVELLQRTLGAATGDSLDRLARLCGYLPLALRIAVANLVGATGQQLDEYLDRLAGADRLDALRVDDDPNLALRPTFELSYATLDPPTQRMFRLLGAAPVPDIDRLGAAALTGEPARAAATLLDRLVRAHLVEQPTPGRYRLHDLLRDYARQLSAEADSDAQRAAAIQALIDYYTHAAERGASLAAPGSRISLQLEPPAAEIPAFTGTADAYAWFAAERANLLTAIRFADESGWHRRICELTLAIWGYLDSTPLVDDLLETHHRALAAAVASRDQQATAWLSFCIASGYWVSGRFGEARLHLDRAHDLHQRVGEQRGAALALKNLGIIDTVTGRLDEATQHVTQAVQILRSCDDNPATANALTLLGSIRMLLGRYDDAVRLFQKALSLVSRRGDRVSSAIVCQLGRTRRRMGRPKVAALLLRRSYAQRVAWNIRRGQGEILAELGAISRDAGDLAGALTLQRQALEAAERAGHLSEIWLVQNELGTTLTALGELAEAETLHRAVLAAATHATEPYEQARAHAGIAAARFPIDAESARRHWQSALDMFVEMGVVEQHQVARQLADTGVA